MGRREEREELQELEARAGSVVRPGLRFRVWKGEAGEILAGAATRFDRSMYFALGQHEWVLKVEADFDVAPGDYTLDYCCDKEGLYETAEAVLEADWIRLAAGSARVYLSLKDSAGLLTLPEEARRDSHPQPVLFMKYLRIVTDAAVVTGWRVYPDTFVDLTDRIEGLVAISRKTEAHRLGQFVRPTLDVTLANDDGMLDAKTPPNPPVNGGEYFDSEGLTRLHAFARCTVETRRYGENWEVPAGFEGSGWWPRFTGERLTRNARDEAVEGGGRRRTVDLHFESGTVLNRETTQPLHEQMRPEDFLRDHLTVSDDGLMRLCGVAPPPGGLRAVAVGTTFEEAVGVTWAFGSNWRQPVLELQPPERLCAICSTGRSLVGLTLEPEVVPGRWYLVRWDFAGNEVARHFLGEEYTNYPGDLGIKWFEPWLDLTYLPDSGLVAVTGLRRGRTGTGEDAALVYSFEEEGLQLRENLLWSGGPLQNTAAGICWIADGPLNGYLCVYGGLVRDPWIGGQEKHRFHLRDRDGTWLMGNFKLIADWLPLPKTMEFLGYQPELGLPKEEAPRGTYRFALTGGWVERRTEDPEHTGEPETLTSSEGRVRIVELDAAEGDLFDPLVPPVLTAVRELPMRSSEYDLRGLAMVGDYLLAAGFGKEAVQGVARVARLGWDLENCRVRSLAAGDLPVRNFKEPMIRLGGEILSENVGYVLEKSTGHLTLLSVAESGLEIRASYDYEPVFGLVPIRNEKRWEIAGEMANCFGLVLRMDELGRLSWRARWIEERFAITMDPWGMPFWRPYKADHVLGSSMTEDGLPWIIEESIEVLRDGYLTPMDERFYDLLSEDWVQPDGRTAKRWTYHRMSAGQFSGPVVVIRFRVQDGVGVIGAEVGRREQSSDAGRVITRVRLKGSRRRPADFAQRLEQKFVVGPADTEYLMPFDRLKPVEGTRGYEWDPVQKDYDEEDKPQFQVKFEEPLLLGTTQWRVECGVLPPLWAGMISKASFAGKRFQRVELVAPNANYQVASELPFNFRLATREDYEDMIGNVLGGESCEPISAEDVKTAGHFFVKLMNELQGDNWMAAYETEMRVFGADSEGRLVRLAAGTEEQRVRTGYAGKAVQITLRPQGVTGEVCFLDDPTEGGHGEMRNWWIGIERVRLTCEGLNISLLSHSDTELYLGVEVIGYPVSEVEQYWGLAQAGAAEVALYGLVPRSEAWRFFPNLEYARRGAEGVIARRGGEPCRWSAELPLRNMLLEDDLVWFEWRDGSRELLPVVVVTDEIGREGSRTEVEVE